eukprot:2452966-Amphidinium_carterae.1
MHKQITTFQQIINPTRKGNNVSRAIHLHHYLCVCSTFQQLGRSHRCKGHNTTVVRQHLHNSRILIVVHADKGW